MKKYLSILLLAAGFININESFATMPPSTEVVFISSEAGGIVSIGAKVAIDFVRKRAMLEGKELTRMSTIKIAASNKAEVYEFRSQASDLSIFSGLIKTVRFDVAREACSARDVSLFLQGKTYNKDSIQIICPSHFGTVEINIGVFPAPKKFKGVRNVAPIASFVGELAEEGASPRIRRDGALKYIVGTGEIMKSIFQGNNAMLLMMDKAEGVSLSTIFARELEQNSDKLCDIFRVLGQKIAEFHNIGAHEDDPFYTDLLHGDLNFANLFFNEETSKLTFIDLAMHKKGKREEDIVNFFTHLIRHVGDKVASTPMGAPLLTESTEQFPRILSFINSFIEGYAGIFPEAAHMKFHLFKKDRIRVLGEMLSLVNPCAYIRICRPFVDYLMEDGRFGFVEDQQR